ncbi:MAG: PAS domain S-box protein [Gammaproteobacteria bacterium]|nr:PAS domain S-box protein [Gammaproteobacteria bacterium]
MSRIIRTQKFASQLIEMARQFLLFFLPMLLILFVAGSIHFYSDYEIRRSATESAELLNIQLAEKMVVGDISRIVSDLLFLAEHIEHSSEQLEQENDQRQQTITRLFRTFAANKRIYGQLRYIDHQGQEQIRINYHNGTISTVTNEALQDKSERYYVQQGLKLHPGEVYLSPMDLNIEAGKIEVPHQPVIRFVTPVRSTSGYPNGIIVLNYLGKGLIDDFRHAVTSISDRVHLVNSDGYWMSNTNTIQEWGFMFGNNVTFQGQYPKEWAQMRHHSRGQFITQNGLFSYLTIDPLWVAQSHAGIAPHRINPATLLRYSWHIIAHLPTLELGSTPLGFLKQNRTLYIAIFLFTMTLSWLLAHNSLRRKEFELHRENELRFRDTLEEIHLAALTLAPNGTTLFCNNYLLHLLRKRREEVIGKNWFNHFTPSDDLQQRQQFSLDSQISGEEKPRSNHHESHIIDFRGEKRLIAWTSTITLDEEDQLENITYIGQDITEQSETREALTKFARAAEQSPAVIMITDLTGAIEYVNPKFTELTGYKLEEVQGKNPRILKSGATSKEEYIDLWKTIGSGQEWRGILHNRKKSGDLYWESALISPIRSEDGKITHFLSVKEDITAHKALEEEVKQRQEELDQARTLAVVGRMSSMIAHDLRNPLSSIKMGLQILSRKPDGDPEEMELHQIGLEQIRYMENILEGILAYSRPDELELSWVSLDKLIETSVSAIQNQISEHQIDITTHYPAGLPTLQLDKVKMRRVLTNLLSNAIDAIEEAAPAQPTISIHASTELDEGSSVVRLEICDNGTGISPEQQSTLFEPFITTRSKGTGLGLAIVKRIIDQHHGSIHFETHKDAGACISITLPTHHSKPTVVSQTPLVPPPHSFIKPLQQKPKAD